MVVTVDPGTEFESGVFDGLEAVPQNGASVLAMEVEVKGC